MQTSEPTTPEETAAALAAQERKNAKADETEEPQTPEQTKAALDAIAQHKDPVTVIKQIKKKQVAKEAPFKKQPAAKPKSVAPSTAQISS